MNRRDALFTFGAVASAAWPMASARAQDSAWPDRPVKIIVASAAGGQPDVVARAMGEYLGRRLGQSFIIDNRAGANGFIGMQAAANSPADGYTLLLGIAASFSINPALYAKLPYKVTDFQPLSQLGLAPHCMFVRSSLGVKTLAEFIALAKSQPGKFHVRVARRGLCFTAQHRSAETVDRNRHGARPVHFASSGRARNDGRTHRCVLRRLRGWKHDAAVGQGGGSRSDRPR